MEFVMDIAGKVVLYTFIFAAVRSVVCRLIQKEVKNTDADRERCIRKTGISVIFFVYAVVFILIFTVVEQLPSNETAAIRTLLHVVEIGIVVFCCILSILYKIWMLRIEKEQIVYRNLGGKTQNIPFSMLTGYERLEDGTIVFYREQQKIIKIEKEYADQILMYVTDSVNLKLMGDFDASDFVMHPGKLVRRISVVCMLAFIFFFVFGVCVKNFFACVVFFPLMFWGIYNCISEHYEKVIFDNQSITHRRFMRKKRMLSYSEVNRVENSIRDHIEYYLMYTDGKDKPVLKINMFFENAAFLKRLAQKNRWVH